MVKIALTMTVMGLSLVSASVFAQSANPGCERRILSIEHQLERAQSQGNHHRAQGLQRARHNVQMYCSDDKLREELLEDIADQEEDIAELETDIARVKVDGESEKTAKLERKLSRKLEELYQLKQDLDQLKSQ